MLNASQTLASRRKIRQDFQGYCSKCSHSPCQNGGFEPEKRGAEEGSKLATKQLAMFRCSKLFRSLENVFKYSAVYTCICMYMFACGVWYIHYVYLYTSYLYTVHYNWIHNVGKTMINHPANHHFYRLYKPFQNGGLWHGFTHIIVDFLKLGLPLVIIH